MSTSSPPSLILSLLLCRRLAEFILLSVTKGQMKSRMILLVLEKNKAHFFYSIYNKSKIDNPPAQMPSLKIGSLWTRCGIILTIHVICFKKSARNTFLLIVCVFPWKPGFLYGLPRTTGIRIIIFWNRTSIHPWQSHPSTHAISPIFAVTNLSYWHLCNICDLALRQVESNAFLKRLNYS